MTIPRYLFVDDTSGIGSDGERFRALLSKANELQVDLVWPKRDKLLAKEADLEPGIDGYILDINLSDQVAAGEDRFVGTGAGLAQDLRLLQAAGGQRPRPVVRLCAEQVFQHYLSGDNSTADIFDLGLSKESVADQADTARAKLAALPSLYTVLTAAVGNPEKAAEILGVDAATYEAQHSLFRAAFETELSRTPHEVASFLLRSLLEPPGLLVDENVLAIRLGVDVTKSPGWPELRAGFEKARYQGAASKGYPRWWMSVFLSVWQEISISPAFRLTSKERVATLEAKGWTGLTPLVPSKESPGERPWASSISDTKELRLPADPSYAFSLSTNVAPWLDDPIWCFEQAKRLKSSPLLSEEAKDRLAVAIRGQRG